MAWKRVVTLSREEVCEGADMGAALFKVIDENPGHPVRYGWSIDSEHWYADVGTDEPIGVAPISAESEQFVVGLDRALRVSLRAGA